MNRTRVQPGCSAWGATGTGELADTAVVLVHGFTGNPRGTTPLGRLLVDEGFSVEVVRLPGHGTSALDLGRTRYADWREAVVGGVEAASYRADRILLVGHSMGGTLSLDVAATMPDEVTALAVINPQVLDPTQLLAKAAPVLQYLVPLVPRDLAGLPTDDIAKPGVSEGAYGWVPAKAAQSLIEELPRIREELRRLVQPLLVVSSPGDRTVPHDNSDAVVQMVASRQVQRLVCERSRHVPQLDWDRPLVEQTILEFCREVAAAG